MKIAFIISTLLIAFTSSATQLGWSSCDTSRLQMCSIHCRTLRQSILSCQQRMGSGFSGVTLPYIPRIPRIPVVYSRPVVWGRPYPNVNYRYPNVNYRYPIVNYAYPNVNYAIPNVNYAYPNVNYAPYRRNLVGSYYPRNYPNVNYSHVNAGGQDGPIQNEGKGSPSQNGGPIQDGGKAGPSQNGGPIQDGGKAGPSQNGGPSQDGGPVQEGGKAGPSQDGGKPIMLQTESKSIIGRNYRCLCR